MHTATFFASSISALTLVLCMLAMWNIQTDVRSIWAELEGEMDDFKVSFALIVKHKYRWVERQMESETLEIRF